LLLQQEKIRAVGVLSAEIAVTDANQVIDIETKNIEVFTIGLPDCANIGRTSSGIEFCLIYTETGGEVHEGCTH
jgi:hypothetical protein